MYGRYHKEVAGAPSASVRCVWTLSKGTQILMAQGAGKFSRDTIHKGHERAQRAEKLHKGPRVETIKSSTKGLEVY